MIPFTAREEALVLLVRSALPGVVVRGMLAAPRESAAPLALPRHREARIHLERIESSPRSEGQGGRALHWTINLVDGALRNDAARRASILAMAESLRSAIAGATVVADSSPMIAAGGELLRDGEPVAIWQETFVEHVPPANVARPAFAPGVVVVGNAPASLAPGSNALPRTGLAMQVGDLIVVETADGTSREYLGAVQALSASIATTERPSAAAFASGSRVCRLASPHRMPVCAATADRTEVASVRDDADLAGGLHRALVGQDHARIQLVFAPLRPNDATTVCAFFAAHRAKPAVLFADGDGSMHATQTIDSPRTASFAHGLVSLALTLHARPCGAMAAWQEAAP